MHRKLWLLLYLCIVTFFLVACTQDARKVEQGAVVNVYTACYQKSDDILFHKFEETTGIKVNIIYEHAGSLINRLKQQEQPEADLLILPGVCYLQQAKQDSLIQTMPPALIRYEAAFQDTLTYWYPLTYDPFVIAYLPDSVHTKPPISYTALAQDLWQGKVLLSDDPDFLHAFTTLMLADKGEEATQAWLSQYHKNTILRKDSLALLDQLAADSLQVTMIQVSQYMASSKPKRISIIFPQQEQGVYASITGVSLVQQAPHPTHARRLLSYLLDTETLRRYAQAHHQFPASTDVPTAPSLQELGKLQLNTMPASAVGQACDRAWQLLQELNL